MPLTESPIAEMYKEITKPRIYEEIFVYFEEELDIDAPDAVKDFYACLEPLFVKRTAQDETEDIDDYFQEQSSIQDSFLDAYQGRRRSYNED